MKIQIIKIVLLIIMDNSQIANSIWMFLKNAKKKIEQIYSLYFINLKSIIILFYIIKITYYIFIFLNILYI